MSVQRPSELKFDLCHDLKRRAPRSLQRPDTSLPWKADADPNGMGQIRKYGGWMGAVGARGGRKGDRLNSQSIDDDNHLVLMLTFDSCFEGKA